MKEVTSLEAFRKIEDRAEWRKWITDYAEKHKTTLDGNFFMDRYSVYDFTRTTDDYANLKQLIAFEEYDEYYVLKEEYC